MSKTRPQAIPWQSYAWLAGSMTLVGSYVGLSPLLTAVFPVLLLAWLRFAFAAVVMIPWLRSPARAEPLTRHEHGLLFLQSLLGNFLFTLCALYGTWLTSALTAGVAMAGIPAAVALLSRVFLQERMSPRVVWAVALTTLAVALLAWTRQSGAGTQALGQGAREGSWSALWGPLLLGAAVFCEASYVVIGKRLSSRLSPRRTSALINLWGLLLSTPAGLALAGSFDFGAVTPSVWALLAFYALAASVLTVWMWMKGLEHVKAQQAGVFTVFLPLSAAAVGLWLGESWGTAHALALVLAMVAVVLITRPGTRPVSGA